MKELEACQVAGEMLKKVGFEHRRTSSRSESVYYGWPGRKAVIRVSNHKAGSNTLDSIPIVAFITINQHNYHGGSIGKNELARMVGTAIGDYMLITSGAMRAKAKYRWRWPDGRRELLELETLC